MRKDQILFGVLIALFISFSIYYLWGIKFIPFHPDESTYLFMSGDVEKFLSNPLSLAWDSTNDSVPQQRYRAIDAPLTRYMIGIGRIVVGLSPLPVDWDWSKTWGENDQAGALPDGKLLLIGRFAIALFIPLSLVLLFLTGKGIGGNSVGLFASVALGINAIFLLHTRRAMAEGILVFSIALFMWSLLRSDRFPWLVGISAALAFNSKHSSIALFPVGLMAICWVSQQSNNRFRMTLLKIAQYIGVFIVVTIILNPLLWNNPLNSAQFAMQSRIDLLTQQVNDIKSIAPNKLLDSPTDRAMAMVAQLYLTPLEFQEVGNYSDEISLLMEQYLILPGNNLLRGVIGGGILLTLTLFGLATSILQVYRVGINSNRELILIITATLSLVIFIILFIRIPFQRYYVPLVPFISFWTGFGVSRLFIRLRD